MITIKELCDLLDGGRALVLYKDEKGNYKAVDAADIAAAELEETKKELEETKKELESKNKYIAKLESVVNEAEEMLEAIVEEGHDDAEHTLREYLRERSDYKHGKAGRGLYDYLTSTVR